MPVMWYDIMIFETLCLRLWILGTRCLFLIITYQELKKRFVLCLLLLFLGFVYIFCLFLFIYWVLLCFVVLFVFVSLFLFWLLVNLVVFCLFVCLFCLFCFCLVVCLFFEWKCDWQELSACPVCTLVTKS